MMRRISCAIALFVVAIPASAQMPPSIQKPIDAAKRAANKTSAEINNEQKAGDESKAAQMPSAASATQKTVQKGPAQKSAPSKQAGQTAAQKTAPANVGQVASIAPIFPAAKRGNT